MAMLLVSQSGSLDLNFHTISNELSFFYWVSLDFLYFFPSEGILIPSYPCNDLSMPSVWSSRKTENNIPYVKNCIFPTSVLWLFPFVQRRCRFSLLFHFTVPIELLYSPMTSITCLPLQDLPTVNSVYPASGKYVWYVCCTKISKTVCFVVL